MLTSKGELRLVLKVSTCLALHRKSYLEVNKICVTEYFCHPVCTCMSLPQFQLYVCDLRAHILVKFLFILSLKQLNEGRFVLPDRMIRLLPTTTLRGVQSVIMFCSAFLTCSTGHWAYTAATVQPNW